MTRDVRRLRINTGGTTHGVVVPPSGPLAVEGTAAPVDVSRIDPTTFQVTIDDRRVVVHLAVDGDRCWAFAAGCVFELDLAPDRPAPRRGPSPPSLSAPMPATVLTVLVEPGDEVRRGDTVVLLEAMKMELALRAPRHGMIDEVKCREGDLVQPGPPLVTLRAQEEPDPER